MYLCISIIPNTFCHFNNGFIISEMVVPKVNEKLFEELKAMGFSEARATRALHYSSQCYMPFVIYSYVPYSSCLLLHNETH